MMKPTGTPKPNPAKNSTICFSLLIPTCVAAGPNRKGEIAWHSWPATLPPTIGYTKFS